MSEEKEEIILKKELEDEALVSGYESNTELFDIVHDYLQSLKQYPLLSDEETKELLIKYHEQGDMSAREKLINHNLRLVVWYIKRHKKVTKSYEFIDLIQTGNIGLVKAVDTFDLTKGFALSTYVSTCIRNELHNELANNDRTIRFPSYLVDLINKYRRYIATYLNTNGIKPSPEEICDYLDIKLDKLKEIEEALRTSNNPDSLNREINTEDDAKLEDFVEDTNVTGFDNFERKLDDKIIYYKVKKALTPEAYYLVYHHILSPNHATLETLGREFGVTRERIRQLVEDALGKLKRLKIFESKVGEDIRNIQNLDVRPINFHKKVILLYLMDKISNEDYNYLYNIFYLGTPEENFMRKYHIERKTFQEFKEYMESTYANILNMPPELYDEIIEKVKKKYTISQIFAADITSSIDNSLIIKGKLDSMSKDELIKHIGYNYEYFTKDQKELIDEYYDDNYGYEDNYYTRLIDAKINIQLLGYKGERTLPINILYKTYINNKDIFDEEYQKYLEGTLFRDITGKKVPFDQAMGRRKTNTILRLSQLYYKIDNFFTYELSERDIKRILKQYNYLFSEDEIKVINLHYINPEGNLSMRELMKELGIKDKYEINSLSRLTYYKVVSLYLGVYSKCVIKNEDVYMKYINNLNFRMVPLNREVCRMRFQDHLDYKEIKDKLGLESTQKVSNIIGKSLVLIDTHHYNINNDTVYEEDKIHELFAAKENYTEQEKNIILDRYANGLEAEDIYSKYNLTKKDYMNLITRFSNTYLNFYAANITYENVLDEINAHPTDCVLNETQKGILAYLFGVKSSYNPDGEKLSKEEIKERLNIDENAYNNHRKLGLTFLGCKKNRIYGNQLGRLSQEEVRVALDDPNVPLKPDEKLLLRQIKGIDTETLTVEELAKIHNVAPSSIRRRVTMSYLSILKYQDGLKEKGIDYEMDVVPQLKYFPLIEQYQLTDLYRDHFDAKDFVKKYGITKEQAWVLMEKLERRLMYLLKYKKARKFDFDYAREVLDKDDLPYFGDYELARYYYNRYFGDDGELADSRSDLIEELDISEETKTSAMIRNLMISCLMYKQGYRKYKTIDIQELEAYYDKHKDNMPMYLKKIFLSSIKHNDPTRISELAIYEILKDRGEDIFHIKDISKSDAANIIRENPYNFSSYQLESIRKLFHLPKRNFMNGSKKHKLYKLVAPYMLKKDSQNKKLELQ